MENVTILLRRAPYGSVDAAEALRHALGGVTNDMAVRLILVDGGVQAARKGQDIGSTEYLSAEEGLKDCLDMGVEVYADRSSLREERVEAEDLTEGVKVAGGAEIAGLMGEAAVTLIF
jgi:sulfur relay (sulfurtransferase) DsrF/TusC family protein